MARCAGVNTKQTTKNYLPFSLVLRKRISHSNQEDIPSDKMALSNSDLDELYTAFHTDNFKRFENACVKMFVDYWVSQIPSDIKDQLLEVIRNSRTRKDLWVRFRPVLRPDNEIEIDGRRMSSLHIVHKTDALAQIAAAIGPHIHVRAVPSAVHLGSLVLRIEYWPPAKRVIHNPEDEYADLPPLDGHDY